MGIRGFGAVWAMGALIAVPLYAADAPAEAVQENVVATLVPAGPARTLDVPASELAVRSPAEAPPPDFTAAQYIDSAGCVFVRVPDGWRARIARDGSTICGYPPTFSARRLAPDVLDPLFAQPEEPRSQRIERILTETILPNVQDGELAAKQPESGRTAAPAAGGPTVAGQDDTRITAAQNDTRKRETVNMPPEPAGGDPLGFAAAVAASPVTTDAAEGARTDRLCDLIGANPTAKPGIGGSSALGFCGGEAIGLPSKIARAVEPSTTAAAEPNHAVKTTTKAESQVAATPRKAKATDTNVMTARNKATQTTARPQEAGKTNPAQSSAKASSPHLIPAGAKYVQIGVFRNSENAAKTAQRLIRMGFPVVKSAQGDKQSIMIGPLNGREAIVRTIDQVRKAGYRDAYARR